MLACFHGSVNGQRSLDASNAHDCSAGLRGRSSAYSVVGRLHICAKQYRVRPMALHVRAVPALRILTDATTGKEPANTGTESASPYASPYNLAAKTDFRACHRERKVPERSEPRQFHRHHRHYNQNGKCVIPEHNAFHFPWLLMILQCSNFKHVVLMCTHTEATRATQVNSMGSRRLRPLSP